jgi:hypothetical protein
MVWSIAARNIGSMIEGNTAKNSVRGEGDAASSATVALDGMAGEGSGEMQARRGGDGGEDRALHTFR